uniref:Uncharacterized protein n=1 Tax=mine drainage metagenome TaxID=410659 RepID=E6QAE6_9ZZZZ
MHDRLRAEDYLQTGQWRRSSWGALVYDIADHEQLNSPRSEALFSIQHLPPKREVDRGNPMPLPVPPTSSSQPLRWP